MSPTWERRNSGGESPFAGRTPALPGTNLARFRWHTGAEPTPVAPAGAPPLLFRDVGPKAMAQFLRAGLRRLAGPMTPLTYLRTADYHEPYTDHGRIGRLVVLRVRELHPWHSGLPHIYIVAAHQMPDADALGFIPGHLDLPEAARRLVGARTGDEAREAFAAADDAAAREDHLAHLDRLNADCAAAERFAQPLRVALQTGNCSTRERLRELFAHHHLNERDLCSAWHHLALERRAWLREVLPRLSEKAAAWVHDEP
jgi:hypothetical protein